MAEQLIDTIRARNPVVTAVVAGTVQWCQVANVQTLKINRNEVIYSWHPYSDVYESNGSTVWAQNFGYIMTSGVAPVFASEWGFTSQQDSAVYGTELIQYLKSLGASWTGWCYSDSWAPQMLTSENPEVRNPSGNLMYKAYHDTMSVISVVDVKNSAAKPIPAKDIAITNSAIQFNCIETGLVSLSIYALNGRLIARLLDQTLIKGSHSIRWSASNVNGMRLAPGLYLVHLKIKNSEYRGVLTVAGQQ